MAVKFSYPSILPAPRLSDYSLNQDDGVIATEFSTGRKRTRHLPDRPSTMKATWVMKNSMCEMFEKSLESWLIGRWFLMKAKLPRSASVQEVEVLITKDPRTSRKPSSSLPNSWEYTGELQIKPLNQMDEGDLLDAEYAPYSFADLITQLETTMAELP
jgi:hypothetical protein